MNISVEKEANLEKPVPTMWREQLEQIANSMVINNPPFETLSNSRNISQVDKEIFATSRSIVNDYPDKMGPLNQLSWKTSIYIWMDGYWEVLVDLSNNAGETSDLVLHAKVKETDQGYEIEPGLIYVP